MSEFSSIGTPTPMVDGRAKVTGTARYAADLTVPGMLHARFVPSSYAHARLVSIDKTNALAVPGVVAVLTADDLPYVVPSSRYRLMLARERVMFVGQPVALVIATSEAAASDGLEQVIVEYDPLPAAITMDEAMADGAPLVWPDGVPKGSSEAGAHGADVDSDDDEDEQDGNVAKRKTWAQGNIEVGFAQADMIVERTFNTPMVHQSSIETHGIIAQPDLVTGGCTVWTSTQAAFYARQEVAESLGVPDTDVRVIAMTIGGGFGGKNALYEPLVAMAARAVGRPVRLILTRMEELAATNPAPPVRIHAKLGAKRDGTLTALQAEVYTDSGCYPMGLASFLGFMLASFYRVPHYHIDTTDVLTFKQSAGAYRAPGAPSVIFAIDTLIDELAHGLGIDPLEMRLQSAACPGDPQPDDKTWPSMGMREALMALRNHPAWMNREQARAAGRGVGIAVGGWPGGIEPAAAICQLNRDGIVQVNVGSVDVSGTTTSFMMLAAEAFGVTADKVRVVFNDTQTAPYAGMSAGSKVTYTTGAAVVLAAKEARQQALAIAAEEFEAAVEDLEIVDGKIQVKGVPNKAIALNKIAEETMKFDGKYPPVFAHGRNAITTQAPGFSAQLAEVSVDQETGEVKLHRLVVAQDVGRAINPLAVEGQMMGGSTQGVGWALYEKMDYDENGQLLSGSWMDYAVPDITQAAPIIETVIVEVPSDFGPFGARGVGEPPVVPTAAAIANAIADATGVRMTELPMTARVVLERLEAARRRN